MTAPPSMDLRAFFRELLEDWGSEYMAELQDMLCKHGLHEMRPLTQADMDTGADYCGAKEGDVGYLPTPAFEAWLNEGKRP